MVPEGQIHAFRERGSWSSSGRLGFGCRGLVRTLLSGLVLLRCAQAP